MADTRNSRTQRIRVAATVGTIVALMLIAQSVPLPLVPSECPQNDNITCHFETTEEDLPSFTDLTTANTAIDLIHLLSNARSWWGHSTAPPSHARNIFFVHTTCEEELTPTQACAVEAAARLHPRWNVHVLFAAPVSFKCALGSVLASIALPNVRFARVHFLDYVRDTPYYKIAWGRRMLKRSHITTATLLRLATLYKYDGVVLDMDRILSGPLDKLGVNFLTSENGVISSGLMGLGGFPREDFSNDIVREVQQSIDVRSCEDFNAEEELKTFAKNMRAEDIDFVNSHTNTIMLYNKKDLLRPPSAGPTPHDCPNVVQFITNHTVNVSQNVSSDGTAIGD